MFLPATLILNTIETFYLYDINDKIVEPINEYEIRELNALFIPNLTPPTPKPNLFLRRNHCDTFEFPQGWEGKPELISVAYKAPPLVYWLPEDNPYCIYREDGEETIIHTVDHRTGKPSEKPVKVEFIQTPSKEWQFTPQFYTRPNYQTREAAQVVFRADAQDWLSHLLADYFIEEKIPTEQLPEWAVALVRWRRRWLALNLTPDRAPGLMKRAAE